IERGQAISSSPATEVEVVRRLCATDDAYFGDRGPGATVGTSRHPQLQRAPSHLARGQGAFEASDELGQSTLGLRERLRARGERGTGQCAALDVAEFALEADVVPAQHCL